MTKRRSVAVFAAWFWLGLPLAGLAAPPAAAPPDAARQDAAPPGGPPWRWSPGAWWRMPETVRAIGLSPEQTARLEEIFREERRRLVDLRAEVEKARLDLEEALGREPFDEAAVAPVVDRFEARRAELARARTMMLVRMRGVLTKAQYEALRARLRERARDLVTDHAGR